MDKNSLICKHAKKGELVLNGKELESLPENIGSLNGLIVLDLSHNRLTFLPESIGNLTKLTKLDLSDNQLTILPESIGNLICLKSLYLWQDRLWVLPEGIGKLVRLTRLDLSGNLLIDLPESIGNLVNLIRLDLSGNELASLPKSIGNLVSLKRLDLSGNKLTTLPESIGGIANIVKLDLSDNQLTDLPTSITNLSCINSLNLSNNRLNNLPLNIGNLSSISNLNLSNNNLTGLPESIGGLSRLKTLDLRANSLSSLPENIGNLSDLKTLDLSENQLEILLASIGKLNQLSVIDLSGNKLVAVPESIGELSLLTSLDLSGNELLRLPESIGCLVSLTMLNLCKNQLTFLPESIGNLLNLTILDLNGNKLSHLPKGITNLDGLASLNLGTNKFERLPDNIGNLVGLTSLELRNNHLASLPESMCNLISLKSLGLRGNRFVDVPEIIGNINSLSRLDLSNNYIDSLPTWLGKIPLIYFNISGMTLDRIPDTTNFIKLLSKGVFFDDLFHDEGVVMKDTKLQLQPISLFHQGYEMIEEYFKSEKVRISESKIIFVGEGGAGKTYLLKRIMNNGEKYDSNGQYYETDKTPGINICDYVARDDLSIRFWDFGGQEIMNSMHKCFLTDRTGYVVVINTRQSDRAKKAREWVRSVGQYGKNAPVIILLNIWGDDPDDAMVGIKELQSLNPNVRRIIRCSIKDADNYEFRKFVAKHIFELAESLDSHKMEFPISWNNIRKELVGMRESNTHYIKYEEYFEICKKHGLQVEDICVWLAEWFNDLGDCFSFNAPTNENHKEFGNYRLLQPKWLTKAIYTIILKCRNDRKDGIVTMQRIHEALKNPVKDDIDNIDFKYNEKECEYVLQVMRRFKMSYPVGDDEEFVAALCVGDLKEDREPKKWKHHFLFEYEYDNYLPNSVLHQLMVESYAAGSRLQKMWKHGFNMHRGETEVDAVIDSGKKDYSVCIDIYSNTTQDNVAYLLTWLREKMKRINNRLSLNPKQYVCTDDGDRFDLEYILSIRQRGVEIFPGIKRNLNIDKDLLGIVYSDKIIASEIQSAISQKGKLDDYLSKVAYKTLKATNATDQEMKKRGKKLFISHSEKDQEIVCEIAELFSNLGFDQSTLFCSSYAGYNIKLSADVNGELERQFDENELYVLFVVSNDFEKSAYCQNEVGLTIGKKMKYDVLAVPNFEPQNMKGMISNGRILVKLDQKEYEVKDRLNELYDKATSFCGIDKRPEWERKRDRFIKSIRDRICENIRK